MTYENQNWLTKLWHIKQSMTLVGQSGHWWGALYVKKLLDWLWHCDRRVTTTIMLMNLQIFLCALLAPVCLDERIQPCRSLCEVVKAHCEDRMLSYGYPWPDVLQCRQFPDNTDLCIGPRATNSAGRCVFVRHIAIYGYRFACPGFQPTLTRP